MTYVIIFAYTAIVASLLCQSKSGLIACGAVSVLLATFAALRGSDVAFDFTVYEDWYLNRDMGVGLLERPGLFEYLYFFANDFFSANEIQFRIFIWVLSFVAVFIKMKVIVDFAKSDLAVGVSVLIYEFTFYLLHEFTQIRVGVAIAFIFMAVRALVSGSRTSFVLLVVLAAGFHSSAVLAFMLLLPYRSYRAHWVDWGLFMIAGLLMTGFAIGVPVDAGLFDVLAKFDPRVALYISLANSGVSESANPLAISALLLLTLAVSLFNFEFNRGVTSALNERDIYAIVLVRRSILIGLIFLTSLSSIPELALRFFEFSIALLPILAVIIFSQSGWVLQKYLLLLWAFVVSYIYIVRDEGLVQSYVLFFL